MKSGKLFAVLAMTIWLIGCAPTVVGGDCSWVVKIIPDPGADQRWTRSEQEQVVAHNENVETECR